MHGGYGHRIAETKIVKFVKGRRIVPRSVNFIYAKNRALSDYAKMCGISTSYFISCFTKEYGMPPYRYLTQIRISQAKHLLLETGFSISEIARSVGYADPFCFSRIFRKYAGMSPSEFRCSTADQ